MKWDALKILGLEKDNQRLEIERDTAQESAEQADALRTIEEDVVRSTLDRIDAIDRDTEVARERGRNDVRKIQRELETLEDERQARLAELSEVEHRQQEAMAALAKSTHPEEVQRAVSKAPQPALLPVADPLPTVAPRIAERIVGGLWDDYCGEVSNDRRCTARHLTEKDAAGSTAQ